MTATTTTTTTTTVAVAGGTKGLGLTIAEALAVHGKHNVVIFSRKVSDIFSGTRNIALLTLRRVLLV